MAFEYDEHNKERLFRSIWGGRTTLTNLPEGLYKALAEHFSDAVTIGMGNPDPNSIMLNDLTHNVYYFSGAKTFQQVKDMQEFIRDADGLRVPYSEFKKQANTIFTQYNQNWLKTEYNTATGQSQMAQQWSDIQRDKDIRPKLKYRTSEDERVCPICKPLDLFTAYVDDPIWDSIMPLNHYGCICTVTQESEDEPLTETKPDINVVPDEFQFNPGKSGEVFPPDHPYFQVPPEYEDLKAHNFNLPLPKSPDDNS